MPGYIVDNSVLSAFFNVSDVHHGLAEKFFSEHAHDTLYFPGHAFFELQHSLARRRGEGTFAGAPPWTGKAKCVAVDGHLYARCKAQNLFEVFAGLKSGDLIYACIAKLEGLTLVTCDGDFDKVDKIVQVLRLNR